MIELTFIEKLNRVYEKLDRLSHIKKSDAAYSEANGIARELNYLLQDNNNIRIDIKILDKYSYSASDKQKSYIIDEFRKESMTDISNFISRNKVIPDSSIE
jgi:hypothetical protein